MRLKSIRIENYQCFSDSKEIPIHDLTIFIGENDCGKTCIMRALQLVLKNKPMSIEEFHTIKDVRKEHAKITLTFTVDNQNTESIPKQFLINSEVLIRKEFELDEKEKILSSILVLSHKFNDDRLNDIASLKASDLKTILPEHNLKYTSINKTKKGLPPSI